MKRTRALEMLEHAGMAYELRAFDASEFSAAEVAQQLGLALASVFKTLVVSGNKGGLAMALVPGDRELSLKKLAQATGDKRIELVPVDDLQRLTGYLKGGVSPLGSKKAMPLFVDQSALAHQTISVSAGLRGMQILIAPADLIAIAKAQLADLAE